MTATLPLLGTLVLSLAATPARAQAVGAPASMDRAEPLWLRSLDARLPQASAEAQEIRQAYELAWQMSQASDVLEKLGYSFEEDSPSLIDADTKERLSDSDVVKLMADYGRGTDEKIKKKLQAALETLENSGALERFQDGYSLPGQKRLLTVAELSRIAMGIPEQPEPEPMTRLASVAPVISGNVRGRYADAGRALLLRDAVARPPLAAAPAALAAQAGRVPSLSETPLAAARDAALGVPSAALQAVQAALSAVMDIPREAAALRDQLLVLALVLAAPPSNRFPDLNEVKEYVKDPDNEKLFSPKSGGAPIFKIDEEHLVKIDDNNPRTTYLGTIKDGRLRWTLVVDEDDSIKAARKAILDKKNPAPKATPPSDPTTPSQTMKEPPPPPAEAWIASINGSQGRPSRITIGDDTFYVYRGADSREWGNLLYPLPDGRLLRLSFVDDGRPEVLSDKDGWLNASGNADLRDAINILSRAVRDRYVSAKILEDMNEIPVPGEDRLFLYQGGGERWLGDPNYLLPDGSILCFNDDYTQFMIRAKDGWSDAKLEYGKVFTKSNGEWNTDPVKGLRVEDIEDGRKAILRQRENMHWPKTRDLFEELGATKLPGQNNLYLYSGTSPSLWGHVMYLLSDGRVMIKNSSGYGGGVYIADLGKDGKVDWGSLIDPKDASSEVRHGIEAIDERKAMDSLGIQDENKHVLRFKDRRNLYMVYETHKTRRRNSWSTPRKGTPTYGEYYWQTTFEAYTLSIGPDGKLVKDKAEQSLLAGKKYILQFTKNPRVYSFLEDSQTKYVYLMEDGRLVTRQKAGPDYPNPDILITRITDGPEYLGSPFVDATPEQESSREVKEAVTALENELKK